MIFTLLLAMIPMCIYGDSIYQGYWKILTHIKWYGINWNASWLGLCSRIFGEPSHLFHTVIDRPLLGQIIYDSIFLFYVACVYYFSKKNTDSSLTFAFTLSTMLLISPLGWSYYFPMLISALLINIISAEYHRYYISLTCLLLLSLFLSALPFPLYENNQIPVIELVSHGNIFFIALLLFNTANLLLLILSPGKQLPLVLTQKYKMAILCLCLLPSMIGIGTIAYSFSKKTVPHNTSKALASAEELQLNHK
jgi:hypothetical protein